MSDADDDDKQFEPTQKKLEDARSKGEIAKSNDLTTAASYLGIFIVLAFFGEKSATEVGSVLMALLDRSSELSELLSDTSPTPLAGSVFSLLGPLLLAWFAIPFALSVLSLVGQRAFIVSPTKIVPKLSRISMVAGFKNKFGRQGIFEFVKSFCKLLIYCLVLGIFLRNQMHLIIGSITLSPNIIAGQLGHLLVSLMTIVIIIATLIGVIDYIWQRAEHIRKNRMSRKEMQDEFKNAEGDPHMKQLRRQKAAALSMSQIRVEVPKADVIVVNPTHYAVALQWNRKSLGAPICLAKGVDALAATIREVAIENAIPIYSDPPTARALHATVDIGCEISPDFYAVVAAAIRFAEAIRQKANN